MEKELQREKTSNEKFDVPQVVTELQEMKTSLQQELKAKVCSFTLFFTIFAGILRINLYLYFFVSTACTKL